MSVRMPNVLSTAPPAVPVLRPLTRAGYATPKPGRYCRLPPRVTGYLGMARCRLDPGFPSL